MGRVPPPSDCVGTVSLPEGWQTHPALTRRYIISALIGGLLGTVTFQPPPNAPGNCRKTRESLPPVRPPSKHRRADLRPDARARRPWRDRSPTRHRNEAAVRRRRERRGLALIKRPELRAQQFINYEGRQFGFPREPTVLHLERYASESKLGKVLPGVDLDLQPQLQRWGILGVEAIYERDPPLLEETRRRAEPWIERTTNGVEGLADRPGLYLHEIDVLRVSRGRKQVELV